MTVSLVFFMGFAVSRTPGCFDRKIRLLAYLKYQVAKVLVQGYA